MESRSLANITTRLEERDNRSKWDWVTLAAGMLIATALAGAGAIYFTKQELDTANFQDAIRLIQNGDDAYWCDLVNGQIINGNDRSIHCVIHMPEFQKEEPIK